MRFDEAYVEKLEARIKELEAENQRLRGALAAIADGMTEDGPDVAAGKALEDK